MASALAALLTVRLPLPLSTPVKVAPPVLLLVMVVVALTPKLRALLNAVDPVRVKLPPPKTKLPEVAPRFASDEIDSVPALMAVLPV